MACAFVRLPAPFRSDRSEYENAKPFPHVVLDDIFGSVLCARAAQEFPHPDDPAWHTFTGPLEWGKQEGKAEIAGPAVKDLHSLLASDVFVQWLSALTGIEDLRSDPLRRGGGIHQVREDGRLGLHVDFNLPDPDLALERRVNTILFVEDNPWPGAALELHRDGLTKWVVPTCDRLVVFEAGDDTWHGHPRPLEPPTRHQTRKSIPSYYFSKAREGVVARSTQFLEEQ